MQALRRYGPSHEAAAARTCGTLANLAMTDAAEVEIVGLGALPLVVAAMLAHPHALSVQVRPVEWSGEGERGKSAQLRRGGPEGKACPTPAPFPHLLLLLLPPLLLLLSQREACCALQNLTGDDDSVVRALDVPPAGATAAALVYALSCHGGSGDESSDEADVVRTGSSALKHLAGVPRGRADVRRAGGGDVLRGLSGRYRAGQGAGDAVREALAVIDR